MPIFDVLLIKLSTLYCTHIHISYIVHTHTYNSITYSLKIASTLTAFLSRWITQLITSRKQSNRYFASYVKRNQQHHSSETKTYSYYWNNYSYQSIKPFLASFLKKHMYLNQLRHVRTYAHTTHASRTEAFKLLSDPLSLFLIVFTSLMSLCVQ